MKARLVAHRDFRIGPVDPRIYGAFLEHIGRAIYTGIYEPTHPTADADGFRQDVLALVRKLNVPLVRYPGGNFVSAYNWEDGVGPREQRPTRLDLAWRTRENNAVGVEEFARWCAAAGSELMMAINLGTRGHDAAMSLLEYCNHSSGSYWSDLRRRHGRAEPYNIRLWCLGNEMDGPWQIGHKTAHEYGRVANEIGRAMKSYDAKLELVACGSTHYSMKTYPAWEAEVLEECYDTVDYVSLHSYFENYEADPANFLAKPLVMERYIHTVVGTIDYVKAKVRSKKDLYISFDEWNVWYHRRREDNAAWANWDWPLAPPLHEEIYTFEDVLLVGCVINAFIRRCDKVKIACIAQLVNVIAPITTEPNGRVWCQTTYYPLYLASMHGRGDGLHVIVDVPAYDAPVASEVPYLDVAAVHDAASGSIALFAISRHPTETIDLTLELAGFPVARLIEHIVIHHPDLKATNSADAPDQVVPQQQDGTLIEDGHVRSRLKPYSYNLIRLRV